MSRNATTWSLSWTTSASMSCAPILQNRHSLAVSAIASSLTEPSIPGEDQRRADHRGRLGPQDPLAQGDRDEPGALRRGDLLLREAPLWPDEERHGLWRSVRRRRQPRRRLLPQEETQLAAVRDQLAQHRPSRDEFVVEPLLVHERDERAASL